MQLMNKPEQPTALYAVREPDEPTQDNSTDHTEEKSGEAFLNQPDLA
jgi:hypothetical protein